MSELILVAGAGGALGGRVARRLIAQRTPVRLMSRRLENLSGWAGPGVDLVAADLLDPASLARATAGVSQIVSTANSFTGVGASSPTRVDLPGYQNLLAAAKTAGVGRLVHVSAYGITADSPVDYFRVKASIDAAIQGSCMPFVLVRPSAFMETWVDMLATGVREKGAVQLFGDGTRVSNFIALDDVVSFVAAILDRAEVVNEVVDVGGPSTMSYAALTDLLERAAGKKVRRRRIPLPVLRYGAALVRPFNELAARFMSLGYWSGREDHRLDHWQKAADRFGVAPMTVETFLARR